MIFVTIGTSEPFDRLVEAADRLSGQEDIVIQLGDSSVHPPHARCVDYLPYDELRELVERARVVVMHAGVGSILTAHRAGKRPVVVPRLRAFGEAVDDHQLTLARRLDEAGLVTLVEDLTRLPQCVAAESVSESVDSSPGSGSLVAELGDYLAEAVIARA